MIISDWPEACTFALTYKSTKSNYPEDLSNINLNSNQIESRSHNNMKLYYKNNTGKNVSIENVRNFFWSVPNINIYAATVPDRMHHLDLGLFQHQLNFTKILINKQCGKSFIDKMNNRVKLIPRYKDLKSFPNDELYEDSGSSNFIKNNKITEVYLKWNKIYLLSRKENYEESDVTLLQIRRKAIITESSSKEIPKTPIALKYSKKLYEFCIQNAEIYIQTRMNDPDLEKEMKLGFEKFLECLDVYLEIYYKNLSEHGKIDMIFHIYGGVTLKFGSIIRATNKFHKKPIFSNIAVEMNADEIFEYTSDNGVLLITEIIMNYEEPMHLALVQWYDFTSSRYMTHFYCSATISACSVLPPVVSPSSSPERCRLSRQPSWECCQQLSRRPSRARCQPSPSLSKNSGRRREGEVKGEK
ncbi:hypothetical protein Glove_135g97 [Diversispora epigaea]|uniref:Uncharacterized protein n=1 Tax=Diversispora epigaea TaxID=1348612 RepID=A0A397J1C8_9GLOM|nr:hypothetical protein Glove_135g97 [Diversispora epigaea]